jgi:hypothetical protein
MSEARPRRGWFQFSLRTVLLWIVPYAAVVACIVAWPLGDNPTPSDPLVLPWIKACVIVGVTLAFPWLRLVIRHRKYLRVTDESASR